MVVFQDQAMYVRTSFRQWHRLGVKGGRVPPLTAKKMPKNREKEGKSGKRGKSGRFFHFAPPDR